MPDDHAAHPLSSLIYYEPAMARGDVPPWAAFGELGGGSGGLVHDFYGAFAAEDRQQPLAL